jgi:hypothetical protein
MKSAYWEISDRIVFSVAQYSRKRYYWKVRPDDFVICAMDDRFVEETVSISLRRKQRSIQEMEEQTIRWIRNV